METPPGAASLLSGMACSIMAVTMWEGRRAKRRDCDTLSLDCTPAKNENPSAFDDSLQCWMTGWVLEREDQMSQARQIMYIPSQHNERQ